MLIFSFAVASIANLLAAARISEARENSAPASSCSDGGRARSCQPGSPKGAARKDLARQSRIVTEHGL
eukprot:3186711-Pyramimonas_sp.AAC.1